LAKAKEMRPLAEKLIHRARQPDYQGHLFLFRNLQTAQAIKKAKEVAARFQ
jgi:ribosomal protein L17